MVGFCFSENHPPLDEGHLIELFPLLIFQVRTAGSSMGLLAAYRFMPHHIDPALGCLGAGVPQDSLHRSLTRPGHSGLCRAH